MFKNFGLIAAAGDRHLAEFTPGKWYLKNPEEVKEWKFGLTTVKWRVEDLQRRLERSKRLVSGEEEFTIRETGEDGVKQIKALLGLDEMVTNVNVPNYGQIENLPMGSVVETNALFRKDILLPICSGKIPDGINSIISRHINNVNLVIESVLKEDKELAFLAFLNDPLMGQCTLKEARELFETMINNTKEYLPEFFWS